MKLSKMRLLIILLLIFSCRPKEFESLSSQINDRPVEITEIKFQTILDSAALNGSILIFDESTNQFHSNDFEWSNTGQLPASTFKIPNSIIALETGVVDSDTSILKWDGEPRRFESWEEDMTLREAFLRSCLPCYREIARTVGLERMKEMTSKLEYGNLKFDSTNLDLFWVQGESTITPFEQIDFLRRIANSDLAISNRTDEFIKKIMILEENDSFTLRAKTGWSIVDDHDNGWFVGYLTIQDSNYFFATNVEPGEGFDMDDFSRIRKEVTMAAFKALEVI